MIYYIFYIFYKKIIRNGMMITGFRFSESLAFVTALFFAGHRPITIEFDFQPIKTRLRFGQSQCLFCLVKDKMHCDWPNRVRKKQLIFSKCYFIYINFIEHFDINCKI